MGDGLGNIGATEKVGDTKERIYDLEKEIEDNGSLKTLFQAVVAEMICLRKAWERNKSEDLPELCAVALSEAGNQRILKGKLLEAELGTEGSIEENLQQALTYYQAIHRQLSPMN